MTVLINSDPPAEPPHEAVVLDRSNDAWQNDGFGWNCTFHGELYEGLGWWALMSRFGPLTIIYSPEEST